MNNMSILTLDLKSIWRQVLCHFRVKTSFIFYFCGLHLFSDTKTVRIVGENLFIGLDLFPNTTTRGGVEDTRLEAKAKAKDTKKIRGLGQGQPFRGQTLSRPRTGMLEAKDQGHKAQVLSQKKKKKGLHKNFSGDLQKKKKKKKRSSQKFFKRSPLKNVFQKIFQALHKILTFQKIVLSSSRGQANFRGLEASRPRPRTSKCVLEDVLEAKDVLEDSTSDNNSFNFKWRPMAYLKLDGRTFHLLARKLEGQLFRDVCGVLVINTSRDSFSSESNSFSVQAV